MKTQDFMKALGGISQEKLDALAEWQAARKPITDQTPEPEKSITLTVAEPVLTQRSCFAMKRKASGHTPLSRIWNIGIGAAIVACAVIAVSIGKEVIGQKNQMQTGSNAGSSASDQLIRREPFTTGNQCTEGIVIAMDIPEKGTAQVLHSFEDAQSWIELLQQNADNGGEDGDGFSPILSILKTEELYQDQDVIITAVPYHFVYPDHGISEHHFMGATFTPTAELTVKAGFVTIGQGLRALMLKQTEAFCCCFSVPKGSVPEFTDFTFEEEIYDCTDPKPNGSLTEAEQSEFLCSLPKYLEYSEMTSEENCLYWVEDWTKFANAKQDSVSPDGSDSRSNSKCTVKITESDDNEPSHLGFDWWSDNNGDSTLTFKYYIDMSNEDATRFIEFSAEQMSDEYSESMQIEFTYELTASDGKLLYNSSSPIVYAGKHLKPADEPYILTMHLQPLRSNGSGRAYSSFLLQPCFTIRNRKGGDILLGMSIYHDIRKAADFTTNNKYTLGNGIYKTDDCTQPQLKTISYSGSDCPLYLSTYLTGHDSAEGKTYNVFVKMYQRSGNHTTPVLFSLTPNGQKQDGIWLNDLPQGDQKQTLTALYPELQTDLAESEITLDLWYQPDVIPSVEKHHGIPDYGNDNDSYARHNTITCKAECTNVQE